MEHLEGDRPLMPEILRKEDSSHATPAKLALDPVAIRQAAFKLLAQVRHSRL
jgi:hypothetical protein